MAARTRRVMWLLNHSTLQKVEPGIIRELGFEVFTPKTYPTRFRSAAIDLSHDASLTIPQAALRRLNEFDFYDTPWPPDITILANRYFDIAIVMAEGSLMLEAARNFQGQVVLRAFGRENASSYSHVLDLLDPGLKHAISEIGQRFHFGQGFAWLAEREAPAFADRAVHLPVAMPDKALTDELQMSSPGRSHILVLCPEIRTQYYYKSIYDQFREEFPDVPYRILGHQDPAHPDPNVVGFVPRAELLRLHAQAAAFFYPSRERWHVHYSPLEATAWGVPVIFYNDSLLGRLMSAGTPGGVDTPEEAHELMTRLLDGDTALAGELATRQYHVLDHFRASNCLPIWRSGLDSMTPEPRRRADRRSAILHRLPRSLTRVAEPGRRTDRQRDAVTVAEGEASSWTMLPQEQFIGELARGIDFTCAPPESVYSLHGLSDIESRGRWSCADELAVVLAHPVEGRLRITLTGGAYAPSVGVPMTVRVGDASAVVSFDHEMPADSSIPLERLVLDLDVPTPAQSVRITVPEPHTPPNDSRRISIALGSMRMEWIGD